MHSLNRHATCIHDRKGGCIMRAFEDHCWKDVVNDEMLEIYEPYARDLRVGPNPALLLVDLYNKVYVGGNIPVRAANRIQPVSCGEYAWAALPPTVRLLGAARLAKIPVV